MLHYSNKLNDLLKGEHTINLSDVSQRHHDDMANVSKGQLIILNHQQFKGSLTLFIKHYNSAVTLLLYH